MNRRDFLVRFGLAAAAAAVIDPERLLWVPGAKTIFLPSTTLVQAATMEDAVRQGFVAVFPDGARMEISIGRGSPSETIAQRVAREAAMVQQLGGRIVANRVYDTHAIAAAKREAYF